MLILDSPSRVPYFNIAAEEYLLKETDQDIAFFYINDPSIIVGKPSERMGRDKSAMGFGRIIFRSSEGYQVEVPSGTTMET